MRREVLAVQRILFGKEIDSVKEFINEIKKWKQEFQERMACNLYLRDSNTSTMTAFIDVKSIDLGSKSEHNGQSLYVFEIENIHGQKIAHIVLKEGDQIHASAAKQETMNPDEYFLAIDWIINVEAR
jgi:hypothetical protein